MKSLIFIISFLFSITADAQILSAVKNQTSAYQPGGFSLSGGTYKLLNMPLTTSTTDKAVTVNAAGNMRTNALSLQFVMNGGTTSTLGATFNGITIDKASPALGVLTDMTGTTATTSFREYKIRADNTGGYFSGGYFGTLFNAQRVQYGYISVNDSTTASPYLTTSVRFYPFGSTVIGNTAPTFTGGRLQVQGTITADTLKMRVRRSSAAGDSIMMWNPADSSVRTTSVLKVANGGTGLSALGSSLQQIRVNAGATALEYFTPSASAGTLQAVTLGGDTTDRGITVTGANGTGYGRNGISIISNVQVSNPNPQGTVEFRGGPGGTISGGIIFNGDNAGGTVVYASNSPGMTLVKTVDTATDLSAVFQGRVEGKKARTSNEFVIKRQLDSLADVTPAASLATHGTYSYQNVQLNNTTQKLDRYTGEYVEFVTLSTSSTTASTAEYYINTDNTARTVVLPVATGGNQGRRYTIINSGNDTGGTPIVQNVTVDLTTNSVRVNGSTTNITVTPGGSITIVSNGTQWYR